MSGYTVPQDALNELDPDNVMDLHMYERVVALVQAVAEDAYLAGRKAAMRGEPAGPVGVAYDATREDET